MEELDLLKKNWQQNNHDDMQVSENQIYDMLKSQSSSVVKWILIIGIVEFLFWFALNVFASDESDVETAGLGKYIFYINLFTYVNYAIVLIFIYFFYKNYKSISTVSDTRTLMSDIIKVRKTVNGYVAYNLSMFGILLLTVSVLSLLNVPELNGLRAKFFDGNHNLQVLIIVGLILLFVLLLVFVFWIFYKILYGILLKKLSRNYKELQKIDL